MQLLLEDYTTQSRLWPAAGRHILAQYDAQSVVVYQAYRPETGQLAARQGYFEGGGFSLERMSWVKPGFLWMMYRSGWATKVGQETVLAIHIQRQAFDSILAQAVPSTFAPELYATQEQWKRAVSQSDVRLQWDPDHGPRGQPLPRRAIQLGLRGGVLAAFCRQWILSIEDITPFVHEQRERRQRNAPALLTPRERIYPAADAAGAARLGIPSNIVQQ